MNYLNGVASTSNGNREQRQMKWSEDDLLPDMKELKISALTRASKIGNLVTDLTLGGRSINSYNSNDGTKSSNETSEMNANNSDENDSKIRNGLCEKTSNFERNKGQKSTSSPTISHGASSAKKITSEKLEAIDAKFLENSILYKTLERQRQQDVKQQIEEEFIDKILKEEDNKRKQTQQQTMKEYDEWLQSKHEFEEKLLKSIEEKMRNDIDKQHKELCELRKKTNQKLHRIALDGIILCQKRFRQCYEKFVKLIRSATLISLPNCEEYNSLLHALVTNFDAVKQKIQSESIGIEEVKLAEKLYLEIEKIEKQLQEDIKNFEKQKQQNIIKDTTPKIEVTLTQTTQINTVTNSLSNTTGNHDHQKQTASAIQNELQKQSQEQQIQHQQQSQQQYVLQQQQQQQPQQQYASQQQQPQQQQQDHHLQQKIGVGYLERLEFYNKIMAFYTSKVEAVKPLQADETMKKYRFACQKAINTPVNAISGVSPQHLQDKFDKIFSFIIGNPISNSDGSIVSTNNHPLGKDYCLLLLAKKFVSQGDSLISSNAQAAFPIASVIVSIWKNIPEFGSLFLAYSFKESPYLVPYYMPQNKGQTNEEYFKSLGYRFVDGALEKQDMYLKRQAGYMRLYAAVMITDSRSVDLTLPHPYGVENGWKWLCNLMNLEPLPDICATLIFEFLQIAGYDLWIAYGSQFSKLLLTLQQQYFPKLSKVDEGGPKSRLEGFLQKVIQEGKISKPQGTLDRNFW